jgi:hypothetical protein
MTGSGEGKRGRPPGQSKTGGRTRGTPNKATSALREKLAALSCDPAEELVKMARDPMSEPGLRAHIYSLFLRYTHPVPKPADNLNEDAMTDGSEMTTEDAIKWAHYIVDHFGPNAVPQPDDTKQANENTNEAGK